MQRRKKYKNRPIPGGFKTIAVGTINLTSVLQSSVDRELLLFADDGKDDSFSGRNSGVVRGGGGGGWGSTPNPVGVPPQAPLRLRPKPPGRTATDPAGAPHQTPLGAPAPSPPPEPGLGWSAAGFGAGPPLPAYMKRWFD